jgi:hypothetical protein
MHAQGVLALVLAPGAPLGYRSLGLPSAANSPTAHSKKAVLQSLNYSGVPVPRLSLRPFSFLISYASASAFSFSVSRSYYFLLDYS